MMEAMSTTTTDPDQDETTGERVFSVLLLAVFVALALLGLLYLLGHAAELTSEVDRAVRSLELPAAPRVHVPNVGIAS